MDIGKKKKKKHKKTSRSFVGQPKRVVAHTVIHTLILAPAHPGDRMFVR